MRRKLQKRRSIDATSQRIFKRTLHIHWIIFSDASETGYGQFSYIRIENENGDIRCCLIFIKSRVIPAKYVSNPRLELTTATLSVKMSMMLKEELDIDITSESLWTDSQVALGYINNESPRFKIFVAYRLQFIRDHTDVQQWQSCWWCIQLAWL